MSLKFNINSISPVGDSDGGGSTRKYQLLQRISDDSGNEIGTVSGFFTDENNIEYAVVCLDAQYRLDNGVYCNVLDTLVTDLPSYTTQRLWSSTKTATYNTQKILDYCTTNGYQSTACEHCRTFSFIINGNTYSGQLPNIIELVNIFRYRIDINLLDTSLNSNQNLEIPENKDVISSLQLTGKYIWICSKDGSVMSAYRDGRRFIVPVLELPNS